MANWQEINDAVKAALKRGALDEADRLLVALHAEANRRGEAELVCNSHFTEGAVRDAQGRLDEAEAAFLAALQLDEEIRGADHIAVSDTLNSIGIVRARRDDREGALEAFQRSADIVRVKRPFRLTDALTAVGMQLLKLERFDEALDAYEEAIACARAEPKTPHADSARALLGAGEVLRQSRRFPEAMGRLAMATQMARPEMWPKLADCVTRAWYTLGIVSRYGLKYCEMQAAVSFWYAAQPGAAPEVSRVAEEQLESMPERTRCEGDPKSFRLVYRDPDDNIHVASAAYGLHHLRQPTDAALGDVVEVTFDGARVRSVAPITTH